MSNPVNTLVNCVLIAGFLLLLLKVNHNGAKIFMNLHWSLSNMYLFQDFSSFSHCFWQYNVNFWKSVFQILWLSHNIWALALRIKKKNMGIYESLNVNLKRLWPQFAVFQGSKSILQPVTSTSFHPVTFLPFSHVLYLLLSLW